MHELDKASRRYNEILVNLRDIVHESHEIYLQNSGSREFAELWRSIELRLIPFSKAPSLILPGGYMSDSHGPDYSRHSYIFENLFRHMALKVEQQTRVAMSLLRANSTISTPVRLDWHNARFKPSLEEEFPVVRGISITGVATTIRPQFVQIFPPPLYLPIPPVLCLPLSLSVCMSAPLRVAVVGTDVSALAFTSFLAQKLPNVKISHFPSQSSASASDVIPSRGTVFSTPYVRNDARGRSAIIRLGRDILGIGDSEFVVSKIETSSDLSLFNHHGVVTDRFPSFMAAFKNLWAIGGEPFRRKSNVGEESVFVFFARRFGKKFADKFSHLATRAIAGTTLDPSDVSIHSLLPRMASLSARHRSLLLGPMWELLGSNFSASQKKGQFVDVFDHLWQELVSGGKHVSMAQSLDFATYRNRLETHVKGLRNVDFPTTYFRDDLEEFNLIVSSDSPSAVADMMRTMSGSPTGPERGWENVLSQHEKVITTRFVWDRNILFTEKIKSQFFATQLRSDGIIGFFSPSLFFNGATADKFVLDVFSSIPVAPNTINPLLQSCFPLDDGTLSVESAAHVTENVEEVPSPVMGRNAALLAFNKDRLSLGREKGCEIQVVGKWWYASSLTDVVADAELVAESIADRYSLYSTNRLVENEPTDSYMNRFDKSLNFQYSPQSIVSRLKPL